MKKKKLKIAIIFHQHVPIQIPTLGGMSNFVYFLSKELVKRGHDVTVFSSKNSKLSKGVKTIKARASESKTDIYQAQEFFYKYVEKNAKNFRDAVNFSFGECSERFDNKIESYLKSFSEVASNSFDVVHVVSFEILGLYPALFSRTPSVISLHGYYGHYSADQLEFLNHVRKNRKNLSCTFVAVSNYIQKSYKKYLLSDVIYNSIDIAPYKLHTKDKGYIAFLGRMDNKKGIDFVINFSKKYNIPLKIAGSIMDEQHFNYHIKPHIDNKLITYIGMINEKQKNDFLGDAKCLFMPTRYKEAFGRVIIESLACGTPVIAFNNGAVRELIDNNKTGFLIKPEDMKVAKRAFDKIHNIKSKDCRTVVENKFSIERMAGEYENLYYKHSKKFNLK